MQGLTDFLYESLNNENIFEDKVENEQDFRDYAEAVLRKAHGDNYDEKIANDTIEGIIKKADGNWENAVGMMSSGLKEEKETNESKEDEKVDEKEEKEEE